MPEKPEPVYWTTAEGKKLNVDDMDDRHVRNAFKLLLRRIESYNAQIDAINKAKRDAERRSKSTFECAGDIARQFNESQEDYEHW